MAIKGLSSSTHRELEEKKKGYESDNISPGSSVGFATRLKNYDNSYADMAKDVLKDYLSKDDYKYDINTDKLYSQYANQYRKAGENAMKDTVAKATSLTGGYGNSYAVSAGYNAYQNYMDQLNDIVPELEEAAYQRYLDQGKVSADKLDMISELDKLEYEKYRDDMADYFNDREFYEDNYRYREEAEKDTYQNLADYILEIANLENDDYYDYKDLELALAKLELDNKKADNDYLINLLKANK